MRACCEPTDEGDAQEAARAPDYCALQLVSVVERIYPATRKSRSARVSLPVVTQGLISGAIAPIFADIASGGDGSSLVGAMALKIVEGSKRGRGRPSEFDRAAALREAMKLFWERGYEGTSFDDLVAAMRISASSFYNSFGSKEKIYREATDAYLESSWGWLMGILNDEKLNTRNAFSRLLEGMAAELTRKDLPAGCMISLACTHVPPSLATVREMMVEHRAVSEAAFATRIRKGIATGDVPADTNVEVLAAYFSAIARGLAVQARDGASRDRLMEISQVAMQVWPVPEKQKQKVKARSVRSRRSEAQGKS